MPSDMPAPLIRHALRDDCPAILAIYNEAVLTTTASYDIQPRSLEHRLAWFENHHAANLPIFVAEHNGQILGWSSLSRYHDRFGYRFTVENSIYVAEPHRGRGLGALLLEPLIHAAHQRQFHTILAVIDASNQASIRLHARFEFVECGRLREVGHKFDRWLDVVLMQRML